MSAAERPDTGCLRCHGEDLEAVCKIQVLIDMDNTLSAEKEAEFLEQEHSMLEEISSELNFFEKDRKNLIPILQMIQEK